MSELVIADSLSLEDHRQMAEYKKQYFSPEAIIPAEITYGWYLLNPYTVVAVRDPGSGRIVANMNIIPIQNQLVESLSLVDVDDTVFSLSFLDAHSDLVRRYDEPGSYVIFLYSTAVHPGFHRISLFFTMVGAYLEIALKLARQGMFVSAVIGNAATEMGLKLCQFFGMKPVFASPRNRIYISMIGAELRDSTEKAMVGKFLYQAGRTRLSDSELFELLALYRGYFAKSGGLGRAEDVQGDGRQV